MEIERELLSLVNRMEHMTASVTAHRALSHSGRRRILVFVVRLVQVLDQALLHVYLCLVACTQVQSEELRAERVQEIARDLDVAGNNSSSAEVRHLVQRLDGLKEQFDQKIKRDVSELDSWHGVSNLLDAHDGKIVQLLERVSVDLTPKLKGSTGEEELKTIRGEASQQAEAFRSAMSALQSFRERLLGLSEEEGSLERAAAGRQQTASVEPEEAPPDYGHTVQIGGEISGQVAVGDRISQSQSTSMSSGLSAQEVVQLIGELKEVVAEQEVPESDKERALRQLEEARAESEEEEPNREYVATTLKKAADTLTKAGVVITEGSRIGKLMLALAQWVGKSWHWLGI